MSCGCNSNPCSCQPRPSVCCTPTTESVTYTFENQNANGIGVFDNETDNLVGFRGIVSANASLVVTLNASDNTIVLTFDPSALVADIPTATTTQRGIAETATNAEAQAKAATDKILTPSNLAALASTTTFAGLVELATNAETIAGVSTTLAVTPAGLAAVGALTGTTTFADAVAKAAAVATFDGQFGSQLDTEQGYVAGSTAAGDWNGLFTFGASNTMQANTSVAMGGHVLTFSSGELNFSPTMTGTWEGTFTIDGTTSGTLAFANGGLLDLETGTRILINSSTNTNAIYGTNGSGDFEAYDKSDYLSLNNLQTGYTTFANPATLRTCDTATVTLQQLAQIVGTLVSDLKAVLLPAT